MSFNLNATTYYGENVYLSGGSDELGNWRDSSALPGNATGYTKDRPLWTFSAELLGNTTVDYRYVRSEPNGNRLYETQNRTLHVSPCAEIYRPAMSPVEDAWVGPTGTP